MQRTSLFICSLIVLLFACNPKPTSVYNKAYALRDSVLREHLNNIDSSDEYDTTELNYQVLRAYAMNDTIFFKKLRERIESDRHPGPIWTNHDSCLSVPKLKDLGVDEAYRFIYEAAFCPYEINATISRKGDSINLHFILYQYAWDTLPCKIIKEFDKKLTKQNWEDFSSAIEIADFWGLKKSNGLSGNDGDGIIVTGYKKGNAAKEKPTLYHYVYRWSLHSTTLYPPLTLLLKFSKIKEGCIWVE